MANGPMSYRGYLQYHLDNHPSATKRAEAQALLNIVGNDRKIGSGFFEGQKTGFLGLQTREKQSNGYNASTINRVINPWWSNSYDEYLKNYEKDHAKDDNIGGGGGGGGSNPAAAQAARDNSLKIADINERLARMPGSLDRINRAEQNKYALIENSYNRNNAELDDSWKQTQEDYNIATKNRLANRRRQIGVADDDFKKQNDAYARYFARSGSGSSSAAQYTVPTLLARATQKIRNDIETNNAENAEQQQTSYNRSLYNYKKEKNSLLNQREEQRQAAKQSFDTQRSGYFDQLAALEREKANYKNRSVADVLAAGRAASDQAERYANDAVNAGGVTEGMKYTPVSYEAVKSKDWTYDPTKTKIENPEGEQDDDSLYQKYFRDKEEDKKKKGWLAGVGA